MYVAFASQNIFRLTNSRKTAPATGDEKRDTEEKIKSVKEKDVKR